MGFLIHHILDDAATAEAPGRVYTLTLAFWKTKIHKERWNDKRWKVRRLSLAQLNNRMLKIQRNSDKGQDRCVSDLLCLLIELVEKVLDPAGIVWMDRLQVLNLHKPENKDVNRQRTKNENRMISGWIETTLTHIYRFTLGKLEVKERKMQMQEQHLQEESQNPKPQELRVFCVNESSSNKHVQSRGKIV